MTIAVSMKNNVPAPPNHVLLDWALAKDVKQSKETGVDHRVDMERNAAEQENRYNSNMHALMHKLATDRRRRRVLCVCALVTVLVTIAVAMVLLFGFSSSDNAAAESSTAKSKMAPFTVVPLNTTENTQTRAADRCAKKHSWIDSIGLCGVVGTVQDWFGWGDDSNPYDSLLANDNVSIGKDHLCVMPCSDGSGDYGVCSCDRSSSLAFRRDSQCNCPPLGRSVVADSNSGVTDDSGLPGVDSRAMNLPPNDGYIVDDDDADSTTSDQDSFSDDSDSTSSDQDSFSDDSDDILSTDPNSSDISDLTDGGGADDTYLLVTNENTGTSCLLHCPHLTHFHWPGETRRVLNCRELVEQMTPDLCDVVDA